MLIWSSGIETIFEIEVSLLKYEHVLNLQILKGAHPSSLILGCIAFFPNLNVLLLNSGLGWRLRSRKLGGSGLACDPWFLTVAPEA